MMAMPHLRYWIIFKSPAILSLEGTVRLFSQKRLPNPNRFLEVPFGALNSNRPQIPFLGDRIHGDELLKYGFVKVGCRLSCV
jgi:hypothetical protein